MIPKHCKDRKVEEAALKCLPFAYEVFGEKNLWKYLKGVKGSDKSKIDKILADYTGEIGPRQPTKKFITALKKEQNHYQLQVMMKQKKVV